MKNGDVKMAATLFVLMGEEAAAEVLRYLNEAEIEAISKEISYVGPIPAQEAEKSAEDLYQLLVANRFISEGGVEYAKKVILRTLGAGPARRMMDRLTHGSSSSKAFEAIDRLNPMQLSQFIQNEHPQTIALILAHLTPSSSAELLESLPGDIQADVAVRMARLETISPDVIRGISTVLEEKLKPVAPYAHNHGYGGIRAVAELLNRIDRRKSRTVLEKIDITKPDVANSIRELMFVFEEIATLDDTAIREILQRVDRRTLAAALKGANEQQQQQFFRNMSGRGVEKMKEEIDIIVTTNLRDDRDVSQRISKVVTKLAK